LKVQFLGGEYDGLETDVADPLPLRFRVRPVPPLSAVTTFASPQECADAITAGTVEYVLTRRRQCPHEQVYVELGVYTRDRPI
jgi:hypothetical protein